MSLSQAMEEVDKMVEWDLSEEPVAEDEDDEHNCVGFTPYSVPSGEYSTRRYRLMLA
jgi:hypothetical protein